jgi:glycosyltransferase involved in cell wall biosynthesis
LSATPWGRRRERPRIAVVKPDWGITGGAELVLDRVVKMLRDDGCRVEMRRVPVQQANRHPRGVAVPGEAWNALPDYFRYMSLAETFEGLDVGDADLVISTQPPSYAVDHPRHLALFYHHLRIYYDLADVHVRAGYTDPTLHAEAQRGVQELDRGYFANVGWFLTNSSRVSQRLRQFNGVTNASVLHAGPTSSSPARAVTERTGSGPVLCVSRSEFTKRTELFVHAMAHLPHRSGVLVGSGGRLPWLRVLRERFSNRAVDLDSFGDEDLWCNRAELVAQPDVPEPPDARLRIAGHVENRELHDLYRRASCLVAPALDEDYGLTAVEAMAWGLPAVVCSDGGGLADLVEDDVSGLVVEPTGRAIAEAVERICSDPDLSRRLSEGARERSQQFTWKRAHEELREGLARVMDEAPS